MAEKVLARIRTACSRVTRSAEHVGIAHDRIPSYAASLAKEILLPLRIDPECHYLGRGDETVAFILTLDAVNFGSGYFSELVPAGRSGYFAVASALHEFFSAHGPLSAEDLLSITPEDCGRIFTCFPKTPVAAELLALFARSFNDLGRFLLAHWEGSFLKLVNSAEGSAERLVCLLCRMPMYRDISRYRGFSVPFLKRAQITAADLFIAFHGKGPGCFNDIDRLTLFADDLVPHVLRTDGVLLYRPGLAARIEEGTLLPAGSAEEVEIRAGAVHAIELLVAALRDAGQVCNAMVIDNCLWHRGQERSYRTLPRHRTRSIFY
jgi:hypothetical protein